MPSHTRVLLTGSNGFTGTYVSNELSKNGYKVFALESNLLDLKKLQKELIRINPEYVIHLAGIPTVYSPSDSLSKLYEVNAIGTGNLLTTLLDSCNKIKKVIVSSAANIYKEQRKPLLINEKSELMPQNHYACSKLSMEYIAASFFKFLPIVITRPFNYYGVNQKKIFLLPKLIDNFNNKKEIVEVGNLNIEREFNDVRDVSKIYVKLLSSGLESGILNICSGKTYSIKKVIELLSKLTSHNPQIIVNPNFVRSNDIAFLAGDPSTLINQLSFNFEYNLEQTIKWMLDANKN